MKSLDVVASLAALAQESRLALFRLLVKRGPEATHPLHWAKRRGDNYCVADPTGIAWGTFYAPGSIPVYGEETPVFHHCAS